MKLRGSYENSHKPSLRPQYHPLNLKPPSLRLHGMVVSMLQKRQKKMMTVLLPLLLGVIATREEHRSRIQTHSAAAAP